MTLRKIENFRSKDGVQAEIYMSRIGGDPILVIAASSPEADAEVVLNVTEAKAFHAWLGRALDAGTANEKPQAG